MFFVFLFLTLSIGISLEINENKIQLSRHNVKVEEEKKRIVYCRRARKYIDTHTHRERERANCMVYTRRAREWGKRKAFASLNNKNSTEHWNLRPKNHTHRYSISNTMRFRSLCPNTQTDSSINKVRKREWERKTCRGRVRVVKWTHWASASASTQTLFVVCYFCSTLFAQPNPNAFFRRRRRCCRRQYVYILVSVGNAFVCVVTHTYDCCCLELNFFHLAKATKAKFWTIQTDPLIVHDLSLALFFGRSVWSIHLDFVPQLMKNCINRILGISKWKNNTAPTMLKFNILFEVVTWLNWPLFWSTYFICHRRIFFFNSSTNNNTNY